MVARAHFGSIPIARREISIRATASLDARARRAPHSRHSRANEFPDVGSTGNFCTFLGAPLRQQGELIGVLNARRIEVRPFTPAQIKLLETFAEPGGHRPRERSAVPRAEGGVGAADRDE